MEVAEANIRRTGLFSEVNIQYVLDIGNRCNIELTIHLVENWLLFPTLVLETIDRNFNVWWNEFDRDLRRLNYGLGVSHNNLTGIRDQLKLKFAAGYTEKVEGIYRRSYLGKRNKFDAFIELRYAENREAAYRVEESKLLFFSIPNGNVQRKSAINLGLFYRKNRQLKWGLVHFFEHVKIDDTLNLVSPEYLLSEKNNQQRIQFEIIRNFNNLNHYVEPTHGWLVDINSKCMMVKSDELNVYWNLGIRVEKALKLWRKTRYQSSFNGQISFIRKKIPFNIYSETGLGRGETIINGYEYYLISGTDFVNFRQSIFYKLFDYNIDVIKLLKKEPKIKTYVSVEAVLRLGLAYVNDPYFYKANTLANQSLGSISAGLQFGLNSILKLEMNYSVNHLGEGGIFFSTSRLF